MTENIDTSDGLVNGITGSLKNIDFGYNKKLNLRKPLLLWIDFENNNIGKNQRLKMIHQAEKSGINLSYKWTPIEYARYIIKRMKSSNIQVIRMQFPLVPAEAITIHKSQGATLDKVVVNLRQNMKRQSIYVAFSRSKSANGLYIISQKQFQPPKEPLENNVVEIELQRLRSKPLIPMFKFLENRLDREKHVQIIFYNIQSLNCHFKDINVDPIILASDVILLVETWMSKTDNPHQLEGFQILAEIFGPNINTTNRGFGTIAYIRNEIYSYITNVNTVLVFDEKKRHIEAISFILYSFQICVIYRSPSCSSITCIEKVLKPAIKT